MASTDIRFSGSVPANYDRYLVPLLFEPYAQELARRAKRLGASRILEIAAGTGAVTKALAAALPEAEIVATDLNQAMLDVAAQRVASDRVHFQEADALDLPFPDNSFDLVVCQFGVMFYPDKVRGHSEARRVLRDGGHYLIVVWDRIEANELSHVAHLAMLEQFPNDPPLFMVRGPFSYHDAHQIESDMREAGFAKVAIETVQLRSRSSSAREGAMGLCYGSPMGVELEDRGPEALELVCNKVTEAARAYEGADGFDAPMSAHIVTATK